MKVWEFFGCGSEVAGLKRVAGSGAMGTKIPRFKFWSKNETLFIRSHFQSKHSFKISGSLANIRDRFSNQIQNFEMTHSDWPWIFHFFFKLLKQIGYLRFGSKGIVSRSGKARTPLSDESRKIILFKVYLWIRYFSTMVIKSASFWKRIRNKNLHLFRKKAHWNTSISITF